MSEKITDIRDEEHWDDDIRPIRRETPYYDWETQDPELVDSLSTHGLGLVIDMRRLRPTRPNPTPEHELPPIYDQGKIAA